MGKQLTKVKNKRKLKMKEGCIGCGGCMTLNCHFLTACADGTVTVKEGTYLRENDDMLSKLLQACPMELFELDEGAAVSDQDLIRQKLEILKQDASLKKPGAKDFAVNADEFFIPWPSAGGERRYNYTSDSAAEAAAMREFESKMYSQVNNYILQLITEYRIRYVKPYYTDDFSEGSVYAQNNRKVSDVLKEINVLFGNKFPDDFCEISVMPSNDLTWKMLRKGELISNELVSTVRSEYNYRPSDYSCYWRTDYMETIAGKNWRGDFKYKDMYCYYNLRDAFRECTADLTRAFGYAGSDIQRAALGHAEWLVEQYNKMLKDTLSKKIKQIENAIL